MRLYLHIGSPKTGTTAIQNELWRNRQLLSDNGLAFVEAFGAPNARGLYVFAESFRLDRPAHHELGVTSERDRASYRARTAKALEEELARPGAARCRFLSNEGLWTLQRPDILRLEQYLRPFFEEIHVIAYLRRQDRKAISNYSTQLRNVAGRTERFDIAKTPVEDYLARMVDWALAFGRDSMQVRVYEEASALPGSVSADIMRVMGLADLQIEQAPIRSNPPIDIETQELVRHYNRFNPRQADLRFKRWLVRTSQSVAKGRDAFLPGRRDVERFYRRVRKSNDAVARVFLGREKLFDEDFDAYPDEATPLPDVDHFAKHVLRMLRVAYEREKTDDN